jgi:NAD(P)H-dependent FMN reductase
MGSIETDQLDIPIVLGSIRKGRRSEAAARLIVDRAIAAGHRAELIDLRELGLPLYDEEEASESHPSVTSFRQRMARADATVWLTPEYNHGYTSTIKNALDYLRPELRRKPATVCGLSGGQIGGARAVEQLKLVLIELHVVPIRASVYFNDARALFDEDGRLLRPELLTRIDETLAELAWYARALKWAREHLPIPERQRGAAPVVPKT